MTLVGTLHGDDVDHAAQGAAELGFEAAGLDLYLVDELHLVVLTDAAVLDIGDVHAVYEEDVFTVAGAIDLIARAGAGGATGSAAALEGFGARAGSQGNQRLEGAALGKVVDDLLLHGDGDLALRGIDHGCGAGDFDGFGDGANFEFHVESGQPANGQVDADLFEGTESGRGHREGVVARGQGGDPVRAGVIGFRFPAAEQGSACYVYGGIGDGSAGRIPDDPLNAGGGFLCENARRRKRDQNCRYEQPLSQRMLHDFLLAKF